MGMEMSALDKDLLSTEKQLLIPTNGVGREFLIPPYKKGYDLSPYSN
jgi:hypothetical protein